MNKVLPSATVGSALDAPTKSTHVKANNKQYFNKLRYIKTGVDVGRFAIDVAKINR